MSDPQPSPPPNVAALVDAIDARAKQAGAEGATAAMERMLGSVSDVLAAISNRLEHVEDLLSEAPAGGGGGNLTAVAEAVQTSLASFNARLGRLEEVFVQAVDGGGLGTRAGTTVEDAFELVQVRIAGLEQLVRTRASERQDSAAEIRAALAPTMERLQNVETSLRASKDQVARVDAGVSALPARFASLEERVWAVVSSLSEDGGGGVDPTLLARLEEAVARLDRDEASARLVGLVEERLSAGLRAVTERTDEVRRALSTFVASAASTASSSSAGADEVKDAIQSLSSEVRSLATIPDAVSTALAARIGPLADRIGGLDARLDGLGAHVSGIDDTVDALHTSLDWVAAMRLRLDEIAGRPVPDVGVLAELRSRMGELSGVLPLLDDLVARPSAGDGDGDLKAAIGALDSAVGDRLAALDARLDALGAATRRDPRELDEVVRAVGDLGARLARLEAGIAALASTGSDVDTDAVVHAVREGLDSIRPAPTSAVTNDDTRAAIVALTSSLADRFEAIERRIDAVASRPPQAAGGTGDLSTLEDLVRRETELLTQRVAALAVGVEATRVLLEQQHQEAENRIGRKAGEVTRRLAADFGIRTGRAPGSRGRRDPRELGPPTGDRS